LSEELRKKIRKTLKIRHEPNRNCPNYRKLRVIEKPKKAVDDPWRALILKIL